MSELPLTDTNSIPHCSFLVPVEILEAANGEVSDTFRGSGTD